jgi:hypothetical protein
MMRSGRIFQYYQQDNLSDTIPVQILRANRPCISVPHNLLGKEISDVTPVTYRGKSCASLHQGENLVTRGFSPVENNRLILRPKAGRESTLYIHMCSGARSAQCREGIVVVVVRNTLEVVSTV